MIKVKHLNKAFGSISVLRDLNLTVNGPLVLMGPSGCGKTTLLRILMGLETPDSGTVQGVGNIGAVFQESRLCPQLTAVGNICLVGGVNPAQAQAELQTLGFTQAELALPVARLSGGQKRRTALLELPSLFGPYGPTMSRARSLCLNGQMDQALDRISRVYEYLASAGYEKLAHQDFGFASHMGYYSDLVFRIYVDDALYSLVSGGRYDILS